MTSNQIWDVLSGTSDDVPYDADFVDSVARFVRDEHGCRRLRILDVGGGCGNPSIGLAQLGHEVVVVEEDCEFANTARRRGQSVFGNTQSFQVVSAKEIFNNSAVAARFDVVCLFGNALSYYDLWPKRRRRRIVVYECVQSRLKRCQAVLAEAGLLLLEVTCEPIGHERRAYMRLSRPVRRDDVFVVSMVNCDPVAQQRNIDTYVVEDSMGAVSNIRGHVRFNGHLLTREMLVDVGRGLQMDIQFSEARLRPMFQFCYARC